MDQAASDAMSCFQALLRSWERSRAATDFPDSDGNIEYVTGSSPNFISVELLAPVLVPSFAGFLVQDDPCPYELRRDALRLICKNSSICDLVAFVAEVRNNDNVGSDIDEHLDLYESSPDDDDTDQRSSLTKAMKLLAPLIAQKIMRASLSTAVKTWTILQEAQSEPDFSVGVSDPDDHGHAGRSVGRHRPR
jgi:hypothetical protein